MFLWGDKMIKRKIWIEAARRGLYEKDETVYEFCKKLTKNAKECEECIKDMLIRASLIAGAKAFGINKYEYMDEFIKYGIDPDQFEHLPAGGLVWGEPEDILYVKQEEFYESGAWVIDEHGCIDFREIYPYLSRFGILTEWSYFFEPLVDPPGASAGTEGYGAFDIFASILYQNYRIWNNKIYTMDAEGVLMIIDFTLKTPQDVIKYFYDLYCKRCPDKCKKSKDEIEKLIEEICYEEEVCRDWKRIKERKSLLGQSLFKFRNRFMI